MADFDLERQSMGLSWNQVLGNNWDLEAHVRASDIADPRVAARAALKKRFDNIKLALKAEGEIGGESPKWTVGATAGFRFE